MSAMNVAGLQVQLAVPRSQTESSMSEPHSAGAHSEHDARKPAAAGESATGTSESASDSGSTRTRSRTRGGDAASDAGSAQWLQVMTQAMSAMQPPAGLAGAALGALGDGRAEGGDAEGEALEAGAASGAASRDAAGLAGAFPADLPAMQDLLARVPGGAPLPALGKTASAALGALHEAPEERHDETRSNDTARGAGDGVSQPASRLPNLAGVAPTFGDRAANDRAANAEAQPAAVARLTERAAASTRQEAAEPRADSGARGVEPGQPVAAAAGNGWSALTALHAGDAREWLPVALKGAAPQAWQGQLMDALGERVEVQMKHGIGNATIRLDPPMLGSVQIDIRHENGALQVHLVATHDEVARQLETISQALQNQLAQKQYTDVAVVVRNGGQTGQGEGRGQPREHDERRTPGRALDDAYASGTDHNNAAGA
ncbi:flagellar hook-length control protein FliK [Trinickia mobilis]|uniref:flagellar hook-length control protein FliK n=1 Tax=Trinickia mobilis TaxID=2816356 RepID=UPI001A8D3B2E|nr:flagellar hook-length control protein FliK [Trinickia mobilis]